MTWKAGCPSHVVRTLVDSHMKVVPSSRTRRISAGDEVTPGSSRAVMRASMSATESGWTKSTMGWPTRRSGSSRRMRLLPAGLT